MLGRLVYVRDRSEVYFQIPEVYTESISSSIDVLSTVGKKGEIWETHCREILDLKGKFCHFVFKNK